MNERQRAEFNRIAPELIRFDCSMDQFTTLRVGGKVEAICFPNELKILKQIVTYLREENIPYLIVGNGSNILVRDSGYGGVVIILKENLAAIERSRTRDDIVLAGGGLTIAKLMSFCSRHGLSGLEFLAGIPGTVGGAVAMNAGAFGKDIGSLVQEIQILTGQGDLTIRDSSELEFSYRNLSLQKGAVIIRVRLGLNRDPSDLITDRMSDYLKRRRESQPYEHPSCGSVFKNPPNDYAGRLIEEAGLKGRRIRGALISPKHANFIVNTGGARAEDILALMDLAREKVKKDTGIELEPEIKILGS